MNLSHKHLPLFLLLIATAVAIPLTFALVANREKMKESALVHITDNPIDGRNPLMIDGGQPGEGGNGDQSSDVQIQELNLSNCQIDDQSVAMDTAEQDMLGIINQFRQQNGLGPLTLSLNLSRAAAWYAKDLADNNYRLEKQTMMDQHKDSSGRNHLARVPACGYSASPLISENSLWGGNDTNVAFNTWKDSPGHKANILETGRTAIGIARAQANDPQYGNMIWYWVTDFGASTDGTVVPTTAPVTNPTATPGQGGGTNPTATPAQSCISDASCPSPCQFVNDTDPATGSSIQVCRAPGSGNGRNTNPTPTLTPTPGIPELILAVTLPGIGGNTFAGANSNPSPSTKSANITLIGSVNMATTLSGILAFDSSNYSFKGTFPLATTSGSFRLKLKLDNTLQKDLGTIQITQGQNTIPQAVALFSGDLNDDNTVDLADYNIIISCYEYYGSGICDEKALADLNLDGKIDERDLNIFYSALQKRTGD